MSEASFYRAFEDRHRGSRELIKKRLNIYRAFIEPLICSEEKSHAVDLGCGRGEWLEILGEMGISALGIDLDQGMLDACVDRSLNVMHGDAIAHLAQMKSESQLVVSAFHVVEHISFDQLQSLVKEAHRVLKPGGILIMETPNPENIMVAGCNFYLDPSHVKPIPPDLLLFTTEFFNFGRAKILRLQEGPDILRSQSLNLNDVLGGVSPDYAVVAQKNASHIIQSKCDRPFNAEYGVSATTLAARFSAQQNHRFEQAEAKAQQAEAKAQQAEALAISLYSSYSWRITGPLRWVGSQYRKLKQDGLMSRLKALFKKILLKIPGVSQVIRNRDNSIRKLIISISRRVGCYSVIRRIFLFIRGGTTGSYSLDNQMDVSKPQSSDDLSLSAQKIHTTLKNRSGKSEEISK